MHIKNVLKHKVRIDAIYFIDIIYVIVQLDIVIVVI